MEINILHGFMLNYRYVSIPMQCLSFTHTLLYTVLYTNNNCTYIFGYTLRWVKVSSKCIVRDTKVCDDIAIIRGRFAAIYGD